MLDGAYLWMGQGPCGRDFPLFSKKPLAKLSWPFNGGRYLWPGILEKTLPKGGFRPKE